MNARDRLIELFQSGGPHHAFSIEEVVDIELDAYAHELAEKIRNCANGDEDPWIPTTAYAAADLIDPEKE